MKLPIVRTVIATSSVVIYFKKRKLYVDDKVYKIRILPNKTVKVYQKDVVNVIGIVGTSTLCISIAEKVYFFAKDQIARHDITFKFKISERLPPEDSVDIVTLPNTHVLKPKNKFPIRDIVWIAVAIAITYYLGQRIDGKGLNDVNLKDFNNKPDIPILTTKLSWWDKLTLPDWMIRDISDEGTYGQVTRPTILRENIEPIANPRPRRFVVILFSILQHVPISNSDSKAPVWYKKFIYSPLFHLVETVYKKLNK